MSAETLRRAAALMRERAEGARAGRWFAEGDEVRADWTLVRQVATCHGSIDQGNRANAAHIASWSPPVALAVADWLDAEAELHEWEYDTTGALAVARAYLGEDA